MLKLTNPISNGKYDRLHIRPVASAQELQDYIKHPPEGSVVMEITPEVAAKMLERNTANRAFRAAYAEILAQRILNGQWMDTGIPVVFSRSGVLLDGQHRLSAVVSSGATVAMHVCFGIPDPAFAHIDVGKKRSAGDIFQINGVENATLMAAATNIVHGYDSGTARSATHNIRLSEAELYEVFCEYTGLPKSARVGHAIAAARIASPSIMTALHYICARKCRRDADELFDVVATGAGAASKKDPALVLRNTLIRAIAVDERMGRARLMGVTLKAWNAARDGRQISQLRFADDEAMPRAR